MKQTSILKYEIIYNSGEKIVHWDGCFQPGDMSLCNTDLLGDGAQYSTGSGWKPGVITNKKVTCMQCLRIINHVKDILNGTK